MAKKTTKKRSAKTTDPRLRVIEAALELASETPWNGITLADIAAAAKISEQELQTEFTSKLAILTAYDRCIDDQVAAQASAISLDEPMRDRLFEAIMIRLDILQRHKDAVSNILDATVPGNPKAVLAGLCGLRRSMSQILEMCGDSTRGLCGPAKVKGLGLIYLSTLRVWLDDDSADLGKTMAVLDKALARAETVMKSLPSGKFPDLRNRGQAAA